MFFARGARTFRQRVGANFRRIQKRGIGFEMGEDTRILWNYFWSGPQARKYLHLDHSIWGIGLYPLHISVLLAYSFSVTQVARSLLFDPEVFWNTLIVRDVTYWSEKRIENGKYNSWGPHRYRFLNFPLHQFSLV